MLLRIPGRCIGAMVLVAACSAGAAHARSQGMAGRTHATAGRMTAPSPLIWRGLRSGTSRDLYGIACPGTQTCFAVGDAGAILVMRDGGAWHTLRSGAALALHGIACPTLRLCYAVGAQSSVAATTDGGARWRVRDVAKTTTVAGDLFGIACRTARSCIAVGSQNPGNLIFTTANAGGTWVPGDAGLDGLYSVACPASAACFAVGGDLNPRTLAITAASHDGGRSWFSQNNNVSSTALPLYAVTCVDARTCFAVGAGGTIVATGNGTAWSTQGSGAEADLAAVSCAGSNLCYASGMGGALLATVDSGAHWVRQRSGTTADLNALTCPGAQVCYAVGSRGTIMRTH